MDDKRIYDSVYKKDNPEGKAYGRIQWKGTDVCIDLHCECGSSAHFDGDFFYFFECSQCGKKYAVGQNVKLIPLTKEELEYLERKDDFIGFKSEINES